jgi:uncharacterized protein YbjQ (UPF0145 family)
MSRMLISTMNDVPGYRVTAVFGEVFGLTVRSRNIGSQFGAAFKSLAGGERGDRDGPQDGALAARRPVLGK